MVGRSEAEEKKVQVTLLDENKYVDEAEAVICSLERLPASNQLRRYIAEMATIYRQAIYAQEETLSDVLQQQLQHLRLAFVYGAGNDDRLRVFMEKSHLVEYIREVAEKGNRNHVILLYRYMEALIAWHAFYGRD